MVSVAKSFLKRFMTERQRHLIREFLDLPERVGRLEDCSRQLVGDCARAQYGSLVRSRSGNPRSELNRYEARYFSQNGEDGILSYIFSQVTASDCRFVEIGIGNGEQCNEGAHPHPCAEQKRLRIDYRCWQGILKIGGRENPDGSCT